MNTDEARRQAHALLARHTPPEFPGLTERERLTLLNHVLRRVITPDGSHRTLADYIADLGVPIYELLAGAEPLSTEFYSPAALTHLAALLSWNQPVMTWDHRRDESESA